LLKGLVRRPLQRARVLLVLPPVALLLVGVSRPLKTTKIRHMMVAVVVVVGMPATMKMASVTVEAMVVLILGKVGRR
jgi:hypothetical protein